MNPRINEEQLRHLSELVIKEPINSYDLLGRVAEAIRAEPKRLDMRNWVTMAPFGNYLDDLSDETPRPMPACGTVACAAGWAGFILGYAFLPPGITDIIVGQKSRWYGAWSDLYSKIFVDEELTHRAPSEDLAEDVARRLDEYREQYKGVLVEIVHQPLPPLAQQIAEELAKQKARNERRRDSEEGVYDDE